ncbi:MAG TPA: aminotransferase class V-fold PLP-dependent enzyme [Bacteroidetes bacterium]|nr:aminotransferase class V-fold PLP-dependent enzyme [Bacteroidota bacterium]
MNDLETYFAPFRENIVGKDARFESPYGEKEIVYFDWLASGRLYAPIEERLTEVFGPFVANTHTETNETGTRMTRSYHEAHRIMKRHVNAGPDDVIITAGSGMTSVVNKLQRILGLKGCGKLMNRPCLNDMEKPVVFLTHMEHHSNHTSWYETIADVEIIEPGENLLVDPDHLREALKKYENREFKIGAFTGGSNVTGIIPPYHTLARIMHENGGVAFVDFAASGPYVDINMHPEDPMEKLDAIYFSPHKFLGGPGSSGVLIFDRSLYHNDVPDNPGGGTVDWTNPWGNYKYIDDIELREDGGTPGFLQAIRGALAIRLKEEMGVDKMLAREKVLVSKAMTGLRHIPGIHILADDVEERLGVISFYHEDIHYNLIVKLLNDRYGIQVRGGCVCAGTYGHYLLEVSYEKSREITELINSGDFSKKPGWVRWSLHPTTTDREVDYFLYALEDMVKHHREWKRDYSYNRHTNEFVHRDYSPRNYLPHWFSMDPKKTSAHETPGS